MPTWDEIARGYYDPNFGTYLTPSRLDWGGMIAAQPTWQGRVPNYSAGVDWPGVGQFRVEQLPWRMIGGELQRVVGDPTYEQLRVLQPRATYGTPTVPVVPRPAGQYSGTPTFNPLDFAYAGSPAAQREAATPPVWPGGPAWPGQQWAAPVEAAYVAPPAGAPTGAPVVDPWKGANVVTTPIVVPTEEKRREEEQQYQGRPDGRLGSRGQHPPNAAYVSDDGLVSYDAQGYRLDWYGNRAF